MIFRSAPTLALALATVLVLGGCAGESSEPTRPEFEHPTLRTLAALEVTSELVVGAEVSRTHAYVTYGASYGSDGLTITALLHVPLAVGPHPGIVVVHGYSPAAAYVPGVLLQNEQDALARAGYVVLNTDLRGFGGSDASPEALNALPMGPTSDVIHALAALASCECEFLDEEQVGLVGHSSGGALALGAMVTQPQLVDAVVALAPLSSVTYDVLEVTMGAFTARALSCDRRGEPRVRGEEAGGDRRHDRVL